MIPVINLVPDLKRLEHLWLLRYFTSAAMGFLLYDYCLTLAQEVNLFWRSKWSWIQPLFFLNRYIPLAAGAAQLSFIVYTNHHSDSCVAHFWLGGSTALFDILVLQLITLIRVCAIFHDQPNVKLCLVGLYLVSCATSSTLLMAGLSQHRPFIAVYPDGQRICSLLSRRRDLESLCLVFPAAFELLSSTLAIRHLVYTSRQCTIDNVKVSYHGMQQQLLRDSIVYFMATWTIETACIPTLFFAPIPASFLLVNMTMAVGSVAGTRLLLNLRQALRADRPYKPRSDEESGSVRLEPGK